jgi:hypothetical protein
VTLVLVLGALFVLVIVASFVLARLDAATRRAVRSIGRVPLVTIDEVPARQFTGTLDPYTGVASLVALPRPAVESGREAVPWTE